jgi:hypothetical protein
MNATPNDPFSDYRTGHLLPEAVKRRHQQAYDAMREALAAAVARVELANAEGNPIMSAWLSDAKAALALANGRPTSEAS